MGWSSAKPNLSNPNLCTHDKKKIFFIYSRKQELKKSKYIKDVLNVLKKAESKKIFQII